MILHFHLTWSFVNPERGYSEEHTCLEHPRLSHIQQCCRAGAAVNTTFHVQGIANYFPTIDEALDVLRANPLPGDIVSIPPRETPREQ